MQTEGTKDRALGFEVQGPGFRIWWDQGPKPKSLGLGFGCSGLKVAFQGLPRLVLTSHKAYLCKDSPPRCKLCYKDDKHGY